MLFAACVNQKEDVCVFDKNWTKSTVNLIRSYRTVDGGYAEFQTEPELYSTYYFVLTLHELGKSPKYVNETVNYLERKLNEDLSLEELFYMSKTLALLGRFWKYGEEICSRVDVDGALDSGYPDIFYASEILGMCSSNSSKLRNRLLEDYSKLDGDVFMIDAVLTSLKDLGVDVRNLNGIERWESFVQAYLQNFTHDNLSMDKLPELIAALNIASVLNQSAEIPQDVVDYIAKHQSVDGGFSLFFDNTSDEFSTYAAVRVLLRSNQKVNEEVLRFIESHKLSGGGFSPAVRAVTNAKSTFHAVKVLLELGEFPDKTAVAFLKERYRNAVRDVKSGLLNLDIYPTTAALAALGADVAESSAVQPFVDMFLRGELDPRAFYICAMTLKSAGYTLSDAEMQKVADRIRTYERGGFYCFSTKCSDFETLRDTAMALEILDYVKSEPLNRKAIVEWLKDHRNDDGGYGFDGESNIVGTYYAVKSLKFLDEKIDKGVLEFLSRCKSERGGFKFSPKDSETRLMFTYYGTETLVMACEN